jgi:ketosteroid isomerase-like protein
MKNLILLSSLLFIALTCKKDSSYLSENQRIIKQLYEHFNNHEWQKMADLYVETTDFKDPSLGTEITKQTRQQTVQKYSEMEKMFPDIKDEVVQIYDSGNNVVVVEFVSTGTAPDGSKFKMPICSIYTIENGKIAKDFTYYDNQ